jgi:trehalose 6-phosphate phosphatase
LPDRIAILLDFDGTLVELAANPTDIVIAPTLIPLLKTLSDRLGGRVAIVSGRDVATLVGFGLGAFTLIGSHGAEIQPAHAADVHFAPAPDLSLIAAEFHAFAALHPGVLVETKTHGMALHYRQVPHCEDEARVMAHSIAKAAGLFVQDGKMMVELRSGGIDKGTAITRLMGTAPFNDHHPIFLGDDVTDEAGFIAVDALGGRGVLVGADRDSRAGYRLANVDAVHRWLGEIVK